MSIISGKSHGQWTLDMLVMVEFLLEISNCLPHFSDFDCKNSYLTRALIWDNPLYLLPILIKGHVSHQSAWVLNFVEFCIKLKNILKLVKLVLTTRNNFCRESCSAIFRADLRDFANIKIGLESLHFTFKRHFMKTQENTKTVWEKFGTCLRKIRETVREKWRGILLVIWSR